MAEFAYNNKIYLVTKKRPFEIVLGFTSKTEQLHIDFKLPLAETFVKQKEKIQQEVKVAFKHSWK